MLFAVIPFGPSFKLFGVEVKPIVADVNIAVLLVFAFGSLLVYGTIFSGWASNSKYAFIGSLRKGGGDHRLRGSPWLFCAWSDPTGGHHEYHGYSSSPDRKGAYGS